MSYQNQSGVRSIYPGLHSAEYEVIPSAPPPPPPSPSVDYDVQNVGNEMRRANLRNLKLKKCLYKIILVYLLLSPPIIIGLIFLAVTYPSSPVSSVRTYGEICNSSHLLPTVSTTTTTAPIPPSNSESKVHHERVKRELPIDACDVTLWLECRSITNNPITNPPNPDIYMCLCPWTLTWDKEIGACVSSPPNGTCADNHYWDLRPLKCAANSRCRHTKYNELGACECNEEYSLTDLGGCRLNYNATKNCTRDEECNWEVGNLKCIEGKCLCSGQKIWADDQVKCQGRAETRCNDEFEPCYKNSHCDPTENLCKCNPDFIDNRDGLCVKPYNATCGSTQECADTFACLPNENRCLCRADHELYNSTQGHECIGTADSDCSEGTGGGVSCVDNATCMPNGQGGAVCTCHEGFESNGDRHCKKKFNENCTLPVECNQDKYLTCTSSGTCGCANGYKADGSVCKALVGSTCRDETECWTHSTCTTGNGTNTCYCLPEYYEYTVDKTCMGKHGTQCSSASPCNPLGLLSCEGMCQCKSTIYIQQEPGDSGCVAKADNSCDKDPAFPDVTVPCVKDANCTLSNGENVCRCNGNLVGNAEGKCASSSSILSVSISLILMSILILFSNHSN